MITLYRHRRCGKCDLLQEGLEKLVLAHRIGYVDEDGMNSAAVLEDEGDLVEGESAIEAHIECLKAFRAQWQKYQTDACYCDDDGNVE